VSRRERERLLLEVLHDKSIHTQHDLVEALRRRGLEVTQATISRDIKRLGLVKVPLPDGGYRYLVAENSRDMPAPIAYDHLRESLEALATGAAPGGPLVVITTRPGGASTVALAIDQAHLPGVVGTVAGDDTIVVICREESDREQLRTLLGTFGLNEAP
jgi:transcriptional regulator of arginine metabolism